MTRIYPITKIAPVSPEVHEKSCLPFGFVIQPYANFKSGQDHRQSNTNNNNGKAEAKTTPIKSYLIARCDQCKAPLNPSSHFISEWTVICPFCGVHFNVDYDSQLKNNNESSYKVNYPSRKQKFMERMSSRYGRLIERRQRIIECELPLMAVSGSSSGKKTNQCNEIFSLPVSMCPPLLTIIIDGTSKDPTYYSRVCSSLQTILSSSNTDFKGRRMGIFVMGSEGSLSVFDLKSPNAHLKHAWVEFPSLQPNPKFKRHQIHHDPRRNSIIPLSDILDIENIYVPLDSDYSRSCIESAIRLLADSTVLNQICAQSESDIVGETYLGSTIRYILDNFDDVAYHPGMYQSELTKNNDDFDISEDPAVHKFLYAGGKLVCFLAGPPKEIGTTRFDIGRVGSGGFGGYCSELGNRFLESSDQYSRADLNESTVDDIESGSQSKHGDRSSTEDNNLEEKIPQTAYSNVDEYYQNLGLDCAYYAHSVELFGLVDESLNGGGEGTHFGFPYLRLLSDRSGGCGPIVISLSQGTQDTILEKEILARSTLTRPTAFGSTLMVRMTQTMRIKTDVHRDLTNAMSGRRSDTYPSTMVQFTANNGMNGPVSSINEDENLFYMGTCDISTTMSFDVEFIRSTIEEDFEINKKIGPCIQFCFAYTTTIREGENHSVVRRLRIANYQLQASDEIEEITSSLDTEALAVNLFHKHSMMTFRYDFQSIKDLMVKSMLSILLACYHSAQEFKQKQDKFGSTYCEHINFYTSQRIINDRADITNNEILLAQGHDELQHIPLLIFSLLQCDALRPSTGNFCPSIDSRCAALVNMRNMPPSTLSRCIAPRLELWDGSKATKEATIDFLNLNLKDILDEVHYRATEGALLFLDCPRQIVVYDCVGIGASKTLECKNQLPEGLMAVVEDAKKSYRVEPSYTVVISGKNNDGIIQDALVEDSKLQGQSYQEWLNQTIAKLLLSELS